jgi:hypothetical protein
MAIYPYCQVLASRRTLRQPAALLTHVGQSFEGFFPPVELILEKTRRLLAFSRILMYYQIIRPA